MCPSMHWGRHLHVDRMTDRCKNITFPRLRLQMVKMSVVREWETGSQNGLQRPFWPGGLVNSTVSYPEPFFWLCVNMLTGLELYIENVSFLSFCSFWEK